jgi:lambda family phage tail tape measure protein
MTSIRNSLVGLGSAFGIFDKSRGAILRTATSLSGFSGIVARTSQILLSLGNILRAVFQIGLRFAGWVGIFIAVVDVINFLAKSLFGAKKNVIDLGAIFKFLIEVVKVVFGLFAALGNLIGKILSPYITAMGNAWRGLMSAIMDNTAVRAAVGMLDWVGNKLSSLWKLAKDIAGVTSSSGSQPGRNRGAKPGSADRTAAEQITSNAKKPKDTPFSTTGIPRLAPPDGKDASDTARETARAQAQALREVKSAILDVTRAYKESSSARLEDLQFQFKSLTMSEDQIALETQRRDIIREQKNALDALAQKEIEIRESEDLSKKGREEALALIAQQKAAIQSASVSELAASDAEIKKIQEKNIAIEKSIKLTELNQRANENKAALQALEDQLTLVGLYGDALENTTAQLELQQKIREIDVQYQNQLLDLEQQRMKIGEQRYANELANIQAVRAAQTQAATEQAAAQKKLDDAKKQSERNDSKSSVGKRLEELKRSVDPAVTAVQMLDSVFTNMGNAIDTFVDTGKFKFADFARSIIADIAKIALKAAATKFLTSVLGNMFGLPGLAAGGPAMAGKPYIVGEQGPELFVPNSAGSIMTNASMNKNAGLGQSVQPVVNNTYVTNNISAIDSRSVAQMFVENRKSLLGASQMARKEMPYGS